MKSDQHGAHSERLRLAPVVCRPHRTTRCIAHRPAQARIHRDKPSAYALQSFQ